MTATTITIQVNGAPKTIAEGLTIAQLLEDLGHNPRYLAVEKNRQLVRRAEHAQSFLQAEDVIEIVTLVGGG